MKTRTISIFIAAHPNVVYGFAANPANLPMWVPSFCKSIEYVDKRWVVQSPVGQAVITFVDSNQYGILDHTIEFESGDKVTNPMRVLTNGDGAEVIFTLFQQPGMSDEQFEEDATLVQIDLTTLRRLLEN